ncbi:hypothetical protein ACFWDI_26420 [Streptomyces sp. NPDC060064]|uniref:hypothetical protein n=1 Tax=Streptomyces sp. NPDC060064 TaxID=3347049 RepID=UPI003680C996
MSSMPDGREPQQPNAPALLGQTLDDLIVAAEHDLNCQQIKVAQSKTEVRRLKRRRRRARNRIIRRKMMRIARPALCVALGVCGLIAFVLGLVAFLGGSDTMDDWFTIGVTAWGAAAVFRSGR